MEKGGRIIRAICFPWPWECHALTGRISKVQAGKSDIEGGEGPAIKSHCVGSQGKGLIQRLIEESTGIPVCHVCSTLGYSTTTYYRLKRATPPNDPKRDEAKRIIRDRFNDTKEIEGPGRIQPFLKAKGYSISISTVGRVMKKIGLKTRKKKKFRHTTDSNHPHPPSPFLAKGLVPKFINQLWVSDITFVSKREGWLYVAFIMDLASRKIVGYAMADNLRTDLILAALAMAVLRENPGKGVIFHSDKGSQYASRAFRAALSVIGFSQSMGGTGCCFDNAHAEALNHAYKVEIVYPSDFKTRAEAREHTFWWVEVYYNRKRYHSSIGTCIPEAKHVELENRTVADAA